MRIAFIAAIGVLISTVAGAQAPTAETQNEQWCADTMKP
jgi:hypothetical protein